MINFVNELTYCRFISFWENKKRYAYSVNENVGNFHKRTRMAQRFSRLCVGCYHHICSHGYSYDLHSRRGIVSSRFLLTFIYHITPKDLNLTM